MKNKRSSKNAILAHTINNGELVFFVEWKCHENNDGIVFFNLNYYSKLPTIHPGYIKNIDDKLIAKFPDIKNYMNYGFNMRTPNNKNCRKYVSGDEPWPLKHNKNMCTGV